MRAALLLLFAIWPGLAAAEKIVVRGGDHIGFTRLVVQWQAGMNWRVEPIETGWQLRLALRNAEFDAAPAWRLIKRSRVRDLISRSNGILELVSDCDCHLRSWLFNGQPVLDIYDGPARAGVGDIPRWQPVSPENVGLPPVPGRSEPVDRGFGAAIDRAAKGSKGLETVSPERLAELADARRRASQLEASVRAAVDPAPALDRTDTGGGYKLGSGSDPPVQPEESDHRHLPPPPNFGVTADGAVCPDPSTYDPSLWGIPRVSVPDFATYRAELTGEFDQLNPAQLIAVARYYLYFGFGAEARQLLHFLPDHRQQMELLELAEIVDATIEDWPPPAVGLLGWRSCPSFLALWSLLSGPPLPRGEAVHADAVVMAFQSLPAHLRQLLGPRLIRAFVDHGTIDAADKLRNLMRLTEPADPSALLAAAIVDEALGAPDAAKEMVDTALAQVSGASPELVLKHAEQHLKAGGPLTNDQRDQLEALAFEHRYQPLGIDLQRLLVDHEILVGEFLAARQRLETKLAAQDLAHPFRQLYLEAATRAEAPEFLRLVLPEVRGLGTGQADMAAREALAKRLVQLGFPADALALLSRVQTDESRWLTASALLSLGRPAEALGVLADLPGQSALALRAAAQDALGRTDLAISLYLEAGLPEAAANLSLKLGDWEGASDISAAASVLATEPSPTSEEPYQRAQELLDLSAQESAAFMALTQSGPSLSN